MLLDLSQHPVPTDRFNLIVTAMTMHHVEDVETVLVRLGSMLAEEGWLAIADLCQEDGSFHPDFTVPHNGFAPEALAPVVARCVPGTRCQWRTVHTVAKSDRSYEIFLLTGRRTRH
jgi:2-polyprenyl-3-methyl-5-hydroxy-6-metoxy-1,4-benzoquinol methylase